MEEINVVESGKKMLWIRSWPHGAIEEVEVIEENNRCGMDCWYIRRAPGSTDTTHKDFLFDYPKSLRNNHEQVNNIG